MTSETNRTLGRRQLIVGGCRVAAAGAVASVVALTWATRANSAEKLSIDDPTAKALNYTEDASKVDPAKTPTFKVGSHCENCALYQKAQAAAGHAPCAAFANKLVAAAGWCAAWVKAPG